MLEPATLPACTAVPQPTAPPPTPHSVSLITKFFYRQIRFHGSEEGVEPRFNWLIGSLYSVVTCGVATLPKITIAVQGITLSSAPEAIHEVSKSYFVVPHLSTDISLNTKWLVRCVCWSSLFIRVLEHYRQYTSVEILEWFITSFKACILFQ
jgi:hypothetical protein